MQQNEPGRGNSSFPKTRPTLVLALRDRDPATRRAALAGLIEAYWRPAYAFLRLRRGRSAADAEDLVQGFFASELEREFLATFDPEKARFRTFLRICLDRYASHEGAAAAAQKRGGGVAPLALDFSRTEHAIRQREGVSMREPAAPEDVDAFFTHEWRRSIFASAIQQLQRECEAANRRQRFAILEAIDLSDAAAGPSYADLAQQLALPLTTVNNELATARRELRRIVIDLLRAQCSDEHDFQEELSALLGAAP